MSNSRRTTSFLLVFGITLAVYFYQQGFIDWSAVGISAVVGFVCSLTISEFFGWVFTCLAAAGCYMLWSEDISHFIHGLL